MLPDKVFHAVCVQVVRLLALERKKKGLSKYAVAERSGLSEQMIGYVERGMRKPSLETVLRMAAGLNIDLADVIREANKAVIKSKAK